jgi:rhamnosyltransferase
MPLIFAVVVTYEPDEVLLSRLLQALTPQVTGGIVINNGHSLPLSDDYLRQAGFAVRHMGSNTGVATALNAGFQWAEAQSAEFVVTFDQDSEPTSDMVTSLLEAYRALVASGQKVGAVGPQQVDRRTGKRAAFMAPISWRRCRVMPAAGQTVEVDHLITSGCLVPMAAWKCAGPFLDALFIDYVDIEWSLRLRNRGWHLYGVGDAMLTHSIGDEIKYWFGWHISWHRPLRHYFLFRNGVYLQQLPHIPLGWKLPDGFQLLKKLVFYTLVGRPRAVHVRAMLRGIRDGWRGRLGPTSELD